MKFSDGVKGKKFKCDSCKKLFNGEDIKLTPAPKNIFVENPMMTFKFVDKDEMIMGGYKGPDGSIGDQIAHCPLCNEIHLFGFEEVH